MKIEITDEQFQQLMDWGFGSKKDLNKREFEKFVTSLLPDIAEEHLAYLLTSSDPKFRAVAEYHNDDALTSNFFAKYKRVQRVERNKRALRNALQNGIGLTGGIATGKSSVGEILKRMGVPVVDADRLAREVVKPGTKTLKQIAKVFGDDIIMKSGFLNRRKLRKIIFEDEQKRKMLEGITHPAIEKLLHGQIQNFDGLWFYESAILYETGKDSDFEEVWVTTCDSNTQIKRVMNRDGVTKAEAEKIISAQMPVEEKEKKANVVINTATSWKDLDGQVRAHLLKALV